MSSPERFELAPGYWMCRIINGCWQLTPDHGGGPGSERAVLNSFAEQVDHGFTTFDCADIYIGVEEMLGRFRRSLPDPDAIQIHTKYAPNRATLADLTATNVDEAVNRSLRRLGVDRLDLLQFHWWNYAVPGLERMVERLVRAQEAGKIRLLGVTNFDTGHIRTMVEAGTSIVSLQSQYSLLDRRPERLMTTLCGERNVKLLPYGVLAGGFLTNRYLGQPAPAQMNRSLQKYRLIIDEAGGWEVFQNLLQTLATVAKRHDTTIATIAARWALDQDHVAGIILGTGSKSRAVPNVAIGQIQLEEEDRQQIAQHLSQQTIPPGDMYDLERDMDGIHSSIIKTELHD